MREMIWRTPFAVFGAFGLLSLSTGGGVMQVDSNIEAWIAIWEAITIPIWHFVLWPIEAYFELALPDWALNYATVGLIVFGMTLRFFFFFSDPETLIRVAGTSDGWPPSRYIWVAGLCLLAWPVWVLFNLFLTVWFLLGHSEFGSDKTSPAYAAFAAGLGMFWQTAAWFLLMIAINYALLFKDGEFRWHSPF